MGMGGGATKQVGVGFAPKISKEEGGRTSLSHAEKWGEGVLKKCLELVLTQDT